MGTHRSAKLKENNNERKSEVAGFSTLRYDKEAVTQFILYDARPGDIFYGTGKEISGHLIMIVGDTDGDGKNECLHCWPLNGGSLNDKKNLMQGGDQKWDQKGIVYQSAQKLLINDSTSDGSPSWGIFTEKNNAEWHVYRPYNQSDFGNYHLSTDSVTRVTYPGLSVSKTPDCSIHQSIVEDQDVVITEVITNHGKEDYKDLPVTEYVANGTVFKEADSACKVNGRKLQWTLDVPAGESVTITYTLTNKYGAGKNLTIPAGLIAGLQTRTFELNVAKSEMTEEQIAAMAEIAKTGVVPAGIANKAGTAFITAFYKSVLKKNITLPKNSKALLEAFAEERQAISKSDYSRMLFLTEVNEKNEWIHRMLINDQVGGLFLSMGEYPGVENFKLHRIVDIQEKYFMPGDVFFSMRGDNKRSVENEDDVKYYIYLGNGKVLEQQKGGARVTDYKISVDRLLNDNFILELRPN